MTRAYFVSDIHLKTMEERNSQTLLRFFRSLGATTQALPSHLFLVGDIFDLWIGAHGFFIERFAPIVSAIKDLVDKGVEVHFFEGNHDLYLREFWQSSLGVNVHADAKYFELAGKTVRVEHGDLMNPEDKGYLFLRGLLRTGGMTWLAKNLPAAAVKAIGEKASRASREYTSTAKELPKDRIVSIVRRHAETAFMEKPFDLILTGHVHVQDDFMFRASGKDVRSVNLGSWFDGAKSFLLSDRESETGFVNLDKV